MASYSVLSPPSARLMMRWMLSLGTLLALALEIRAASLLLEAGSAPPSRTATLISRPILVNTLARAPSVFSFLRLMLFHLLCPDIGCFPSEYSVGRGGAKQTPAGQFMMHDTLLFHVCAYGSRLSPSIRSALG